MAREYRDRIYIRKDILLKLYEYGEMNQSRLMSICGLNNVKHKGILNSMVTKEMIERREEAWGSKIIFKSNPPIAVTLPCKLISPVIAKS